MYINKWCLFAFIGTFGLLAALTGHQHSRDTQQILSQAQLLEEASSTITKLSKPQCDQPVATFKVVEVGTSTDRVYAGIFEGLTPENIQGQKVQSFIFRPFEVGDIITQCLNSVVTKSSQ
jgi:hypothetical protein